MTTLATLKPVYVVDGKTFESKADVAAYMRRPAILKALTGLKGSNADVATFLLENQDEVEAAFETGTIRRVKKTEFNQLGKALEYAASLNDPKLKFITDNAETMQNSFRWPSVKRMSADEAALVATTALVALTNGNTELAAWIIENKADILSGFKAGVEKREVSVKATEGLAAYRAEKARQKAEAEAAAAQ
jgi:hypothetical protein